jgi:pimeloyl-ACP methyl ester carboxylesterase
MTSASLAKTETVDMEFSEDTAEVDNVRIRHRMTGSGPLLVRLDGSNAPEHSRINAMLTRKRRLVTLDLPDSMGARAAAETINKALASLGIERFSLMAHSAPTETALWMALTNPNNVEAMVLTAPTALGICSSSLNADLLSEMDRVAAPVLALFGTRDTIVSTEMARHFSSAIPKCFCTMVYNATHAMDSDRPEALASIVGEFLDYRETFVGNRSSGLLYP